MRQITQKVPGRAPEVSSVPGRDLRICGKCRNCPAVEGVALCRPSHDATEHLLHREPEGGQPGGGAGRAVAVRAPAIGHEHRIVRQSGRGLRPDRRVREAPSTGHVARRIRGRVSHVEYDDPVDGRVSARRRTRWIGDVAWSGRRRDRFASRGRVGRIGRGHLARTRDPLTRRRPRRRCARATRRPRRTSTAGGRRSRRFRETRSTIRLVGTRTRQPCWGQAMANMRPSSAPVRARTSGRDAPHR